MKESIFTKIHCLLMMEVDGPAADIFAMQVGPCIGNLNTINSRIPLRDQLSWMAAYWISKIAGKPSMNDGSVYSLMYCKDENEFIRAFKASVLPHIKKNEDLVFSDFQAPSQSAAYTSAGV